MDNGKWSYRHNAVPCQPSMDSWMYAAAAIHYPFSIIHFPFLLYEVELHLPDHHAVAFLRAPFAQRVDDAEASE